MQNTATAAAQRLVGARPVRPQPRRARRGDRRRARRDAPTPTRRASCSPSMSRAPTSSSRALVEQREVLQRALAQREEMFSLTRQRVSAGLDTAVELRQSEGALPETRQQIEARRRADRAGAPRARRARCAEPPQRFDDARADAHDAAPGRRSRRRCRPICVGRRADIVAARWRVEAAAGDVAAQRAQFYPNVNLIAFVGLSTLGLDRLLNAGSRAVRRRPGDPPADLRRRPAARRTCAAAPPTSTPRSRATTARSSTRSTTSPTRSARPRSVERQQREQAARAGVGRGRLRPRDAALSRRPRQLPHRAQRRDQRDRAAPPRPPTCGRARIDSQMLLVRALGGGYVAPPKRELASGGAPR